MNSASGREAMAGNHLVPEIDYNGTPPMKTGERGFGIYRPGGPGVHRCGRRTIPLSVR